MQNWTLRNTLSRHILVLSKYQDSVTLVNPLFNGISCLLRNKKKKTDSNGFRAVQKHAGLQGVRTTKTRYLLAGWIWCHRHVWSIAYGHIGPGEKCHQVVRLHLFEDEIDHDWMRMKSQNSQSPTKNIFSFVELKLSTNRIIRSLVSLYSNTYGLKIWKATSWQGTEVAGPFPVDSRRLCG